MTIARTDRSRIRRNTRFSTSDWPKTQPFHGCLDRQRGPTVSGVPIKPSRQLKLLQDRYATVLAQVTPSHMDTPCTDGCSVRDVIGLVLIDLDRLASTAAFR